MRSAIPAPQLAAFVDEFEAPLTQLCDLMMPNPEKWTMRFERWFAQCRTAPQEALSEETLAEVLTTLVSLMHARMTFSLCAIPRYGQRPEIMVSGDLGGAVLAQIARHRLLRIALRCDPSMAHRLADVVLRQIDTQRSTIAQMINASI
jgi:hypothetical protein